jgi:hypothetical protein
MTEQLPPSQPTPGWYPDPGGGDGHRWWDGSAWTDSYRSAGQPPSSDAEPIAASTPPPPTAHSATPAPVPAQKLSPLGSIGDWLSESFRLAAGRAGHFLPMVLIFVIAIGLPSAFATWYGLRDTVITVDPENATTEFSYGGSSSWLVLALISLPVTAVLSFILRGAVTRQAWMARSMADKPPPAETSWASAAVVEGTEPAGPQLESWADSVGVALRRWKRVVGAQFFRSLLYWLIGGLALLATGLSPIFILALPLAGVALFLLWIRLAFVGTVAVLGGPDDRPFRESNRLSGLFFGPLTGRLLLLAVVSAFLILVASIIGSPFTAIAGGTAEPVTPSAQTIRLNDLLGPNVFVFALGSLFNSLGIGANYVMATVGTTLLYKRLGGPVEPGTAT